MDEIINVILRTIVILMVLFLISRILGRKTFSQLTFYDFVLGIIIGNVGSTIITDKSMNMYTGLLILGVSTIWVMTISSLTLRSIPARKLIDSEPLIVIYNGMILEKNLKGKDYNINDILELLREQGTFDPREIEIGIIESDGQLSIQKKQEFREVTIQDLNLQSGSNQSKLNLMISKELIINGKIITDNLETYGFTTEWLKSQLEIQGINLEDVTVALVTPKGDIYFDTKQDKISISPKSLT
jgi:uncharacterized membrane protein YcaP (DUF421 family)